MDHLTGVFHHVGTMVMPNKLPISKCEDLMDKKGIITDKNTLEAVDNYLEEFLTY